MFKKSLAFVSDGSFLSRASIIELGIGLMVVYAVQEVISKLVVDIITPILGTLTGGYWFANFFLGLSGAVTASTLEDAQKQGPVLAYGEFLTTLINFVIVVAAAALVLRMFNWFTGRTSEDNS